MIATPEHLTRAARAAGYAPGGMDAAFDGRSAPLRDREPRAAASWSFAAFARVVRRRAS